MTTALNSAVPYTCHQTNSASSTHNSSFFARVWHPFSSQEQEQGRWLDVVRDGDGKAHMLFIVLKQNTIRQGSLEHTVGPPTAGPTVAPTAAPSGSPTAVPTSVPVPSPCATATDVSGYIRCRLIWPVFPVVVPRKFRAGGADRRFLQRKKNWNAVIHRSHCNIMLSHELADRCKYRRTLWLLFGGITMRTSKLEADNVWETKTRKRALND